MELLIAIGHIVGSILAVLALSAVDFLIVSWELGRNEKQALEEASINLGVSVDDLYNENLTPELRQQLLQYSSARFSSELLRNRISDLFGMIRTLWGWVGLLLQAAVLIGVIWYTTTESLVIAAYAWLIVAIFLLVWIVSVVLSLICRLLTGRYPGQAKEARKYMVELLKNRSSGTV